MKLTVDGGMQGINEITNPGVIEVPAMNGAKYELKHKTVLVNCATATGTGEATLTLTSFIPAGSIVKAITAYVTTILAGASLSTWSLGVTSDTDKFGTTLAIAAGTSVSSVVAGASDSLFPFYQPAAISVLMTAAAGVFSTGKVRIHLWYETITPATS